MKKRPGIRRKNKRKSFFRILFKYCVYLGLLGGVIIGCVLLYFSRGLPDLNNLPTEVRTPGVTIQTYDGHIIGSYGDLYEDLIKIESLPEYVPISFLAVEDKRFLHHFGIDFIGFFRALYHNYISRRIVQGGSTITQQLAKNILINAGIVSPYDRSIKRKIQELLVAFWLEYKFSKSEIMMMYLNRVYFGAGTYGIDAAAKKYFDKPATKLTIFESAILAGLLKAPTKYNPSNHPSFAHERAMIVLKAMEEQGYIKSAKEIEKTESKIAFSNNKNPKQNYMYFCDYVYEQAKRILGEIGDDIIIVTTFNEKKQIAAENAVKYYLETESKNYKFSQVSFICLDRDGGIEAMIGGSGYYSTQFNRAVQANRLPGSAFKLFIYGAAVEYGYQLDDMISDEPIEIAGWKPQNYKWETRGQLSISDAFTFSVNSVSVRLAQSIGLKRVAKFANKLGITDVSTQDMSVALGTTPVTLKDITAAYTSFIDGMPIWPFCIIEIRNKDGAILYQRQKSEMLPVIDAETLSSCRQLLRSVVCRGTGRAANVNEYIFGKTGTNGDSDAWFIGFYDPEEQKEKAFSIGVWIGNDLETQKMSGKSTGGRIPARIAKMFFESILTKNVHNASSSKPKESPTSTKGLGSLLFS